MLLFHYPNVILSAQDDVILQRVKWLIMYSKKYVLFVRGKGYFYSLKPPSYSMPETLDCRACHKQVRNMFYLWKNILTLYTECTKWRHLVIEFIYSVIRVKTIAINLELYPLDFIVIFYIGCQCICFIPKFRTIYTVELLVPFFLPDSKICLITTRFCQVQYK